MRTLAPGETGSAANRPGRYQILARCAAIARNGCPPPDFLPETALEVTYEASKPNVFVFCGELRNQKALLNVIQALVDRGLIIQSVRRLEQDELLEPVGSQASRSDT